MRKPKKPIPEKYKKMIEESRAYMDKVKETKQELNTILKINRK